MDLENKSVDELHEMLERRRAEIAIIAEELRRCIEAELLDLASFAKNTCTTHAGALIKSNPYKLLIMSFENYRYTGSQIVVKTMTAEWDALDHRELKIGIEDVIYPLARFKELLSGPGTILLQKEERRRMDFILTVLLHNPLTMEEVIELF